MQSLAARPMPAEFFEQLVVKNIYELAGDTTSSQKLQQYMESEALAKIEGREWKLAPTVKDAIATPVARITQPQLNAVLEGAVQATQSVDEAVALELLPKVRDAENRLAAPGLWRTEVSARATTLRTFVLLRNASHAKISRMEGALTFPDASLASRLSCYPPKGWHGLAPGESAPYMCTFYGSTRKVIEPLSPRGRGARQPAMEARRARSFSGILASRSRPPRRRSLSRESGRRAPGRSRTSTPRAARTPACVEDLRRKVFDMHPFLYLGAFLFVAALVLGGLIGRHAQKPWRWILRVFLLLLALVLAPRPVMWASDWWGLVMIVVGLGGLAGIAVVLAAMAIGIGIGQATRGHSREGGNPSQSK